MLRFFSFVVLLQISSGYLGINIVDRKLSQVSQLVLSAEGDSKGRKPNLIGEQILELRDGLSTFQAAAFETLYDKKVGWVKGDKKDDTSSNSFDDFEETENTETEVRAPVASAPVVAAPVVAAPVERAPVAKAPAPKVSTESERELLIRRSILASNMANVAVKPIAVVVPPEVNNDFVAVRNIPVRPKPEIDDELAAEMKKKDIMKAQQAVTQSFLSLNSDRPAAPSDGGFFAPPLAKASKAPVSAEPVPQVEVKKVAISRPTVSTLKAEAPKESDTAPPGGFFGFLKQVTSEVKVASVPAPAKVAPTMAAPVKVAPTMAAPTMTASTVAAPAKAAPIVNEKLTPPPGGFFGFLKSPPAPEVAKKQVQEPVAQRPVAAAPVVAPVPVVAAVVAAAPVKQSPPAAVKKSSPAPKGGMFSFLTPTKSATAVMEEVIAPAVAAKAVVVAPPPVAVVVAPPPVAVVKPPTGIVKVSKPSGGFFSFLNNFSKGKDSATPKAAPIPTPTPVTAPSAPAVGMNDKFQSTVSNLLKGDTVKIKSFQSATDRLRSDGISGEDFLLTLDTLFGSDSIQSVVIPLISELPERKTADKLQAAVDKRMSVMVKAATPPAPKAKFSFGFLTPQPKKAATPVTPVISKPAPVATAAVTVTSAAATAAAATTAAATAAAVVVPIAEKKKMPVMSSRLKSLTPAPVAPPKAAVFKVPSKVPIGKKVSIEKQMKSLLAGATEPKDFYESISRELGKEKTAEVMIDIVSAFPAEIGVRLDVYYQANK